MKSWRWQVKAEEADPCKIWFNKSHPSNGRSDGGRNSARRGRWFCRRSTSGLYGLIPPLVLNSRATYSSGFSDRSADRQAARRASRYMHSIWWWAKPRLPADTRYACIYGRCSLLALWLCFSLRSFGMSYVHLLSDQRSLPWFTYFVKLVANPIQRSWHPTNSSDNQISWW